MARTPWDAHEQFMEALSAGTARKYAHGVALQRDMYGTGVAEDVATTRYGRDLAMDELDFGQQLTRDESERQFRHQENELERDAKTVKRGRAGHIAQPSGMPAGGAVGRYTPQYAMQHLLKTGVPPMVAAGIIGNIDAESGWDPAIFEGRRRGDNGSAAYAGQWRNDRQSHLIEFARSRGHAQPTFEDQLEFFIVEAQSGRDPGARQAMIQAGAARTPEQAAAVIMQLYERPADASSLPRRAAAARNIFNEMSSGMTSAPAGPMVAPPPDGQRRIVDPSTQPIEVAQPAPVDQGGMAPEAAWTEQDFVDHNLTPWWRTMIEQAHPDKEVVGNAFYSGAQLDLVPPELRPFLFPVGGVLPDETQEYLLLRPKAGVPLGPNGVPLPNGGVSNAIGEPPVAAPLPPQPDVTQAAAQVQTPTGPPPSVGTPPTGMRTRRTPDGRIEVRDNNGQWFPTGG